MPAVFEYQRQVTAPEIDGLGHVGNVEYVRWLQDAAIAHSAAQGWPTARYHEIGAGWVVRSHQIEYLAPAHLGDQIVVRTWVANLKGIRSLRKYEIYRLTPPCEPASAENLASNTAATDQTATTGPVAWQPLAVAETLWVFISFQSRQPRRVPAEVETAFEIVATPPRPENSTPRSLN